MVLRPRQRTRTRRLLGGLALALFGVLGVLGLAAVAVSSDAGPSISETAAVPVMTPSASPAGDAAEARPTPTPLVAPPVARPTATPRAPAVTGPLHAVVGITDGDTIRVDVGGTTERVRLIGLDAPELKGGECWAQKAASRMQSLVQSRSVRLVRDSSQADRDRYGRLLRHVVTQDGRLVAELLIEGGFAKEYTYDGPYLHRDVHLAAQSRAKAKRLGVWSAACSAPAAPAPAPPAAAPAAPTGRCVIKGNISSTGEKIYHGPGGGSYEDTVITASKGERWFCSEQEAETAGWRKARH